ncbi:mediator of RNA polymerase II transcription subunit 12-like protein [Caerostris extrusa]|uniref:Mediator of RNA polymerase II transcription subunit 12-like protein n=1 Tax=Caerostris extrusa TaxID=172846 RepID=A0AAV4SEJ3_CAEEX|nr:mediator of RNA polymerase II transcription subunit 12-like protein [Caerostris extrusa]
MAASSWLFEKRPLKRAKLGPPDVYPQDPKQKEDELTAINVKQGFNSSPQIPDEYGSARNSNITATKFGSYFSAVLGLKQELNRFQDSGRKRQQINPKDNFWLATSRSKNAIEAWFKDLAGSTYIQQERRNFMTLYEHSVPMLRAAWFIKMLSAYYAAISEAKIKKKRQLPDPSQEWTQTLRIVGQAGFLTWILDLVEKTKDKDDPLNKTVLSLVMQYIDEFKHSQLLSRRLAHHCAKRINMLLCENAPEVSRCQSPIMNNSSNVPSSQSNFNPISASVMEYLNCCLHRSTLLFLSSVLQIITLECQSALVWNNIVFLCLQCSFNSQIRAELRIAEEQIRLRGRAAEVRWSCDKWQQTALGGSTIQQVLNALDGLDRHNFDRVDSANSLDTLYAKVFSIPANKDKSPNYNWGEILVQDEAIIRLLCEWSVTTKRCGEHRALVVAKLLEKRQTDLSSEKFVNFLDTQAPVIDDRPSSESKVAFANLVLLFAELIRHDVFSHDAYMCTLISRGSFASAAGAQGVLVCMGITGLGIPSIGDGRPESLPMFEPPDNRPGSVKHEASWDAEMDTDEARIDADLDSVGSDKDESTPLNASTPLGHPSLVPVCTPGTPGNSNANSSPPTTLSNTARHLLYTTHFPLPQGETPFHDCNQRHILLFGVGKVRDEAKHILKKIVKELLKLFNKKTCMDIADGAKIKKNAKEGFNFEAAVN